VIICMSECEFCGECFESGDDSATCKSCLGEQPGSADQEKISAQIELTPREEDRLEKMTSEDWSPPQYDEEGWFNQTPEEFCL